MSRIGWNVTAVGLAALLIGLGIGKIGAQGGRPRKAASRIGVVRNPSLPTAASLAPGQLAAKVVHAQAVLTGLVILLEYDPTLAVDLDLDDNGGFTDNGDRAQRQGTIWLSDRSGRKISNIGRFATTFDYLDASGESTGTDVLQQTDLFFTNSGQVRAGGFWNVPDGIGDPAVGISGVSGTRSLRNYGLGQLIFLGTVRDNHELYFMAR